MSDPDTGSNSSGDSVKMSRPSDPLLKQGQRPPQQGQQGQRAPQQGQRAPQQGQGQRQPGVNAQPQRQPRTQEQIAAAQAAHAERLRQLEEREKELDLKYGAEQVLALILPVSVCMLVVIATIRSVAYFSTNNTRFAYTPFEADENASSGAKLGGALLNVIIVISIIVVMTLFLVVLYKYRCYKAIHGWLVLSSLLLMFYFSFDFLRQVLDAHNLTIDYITCLLVIWNFGCVGMICVHWKGPLFLQQCYLIAVSALMALILIKNLPTWTVWILLGAIACYDLVAVLCPKGPLRMLVELAQEREEPLFPALIYSSTMLWPIITMADGERVDEGAKSPHKRDAGKIEMQTRGNNPDAAAVSSARQQQARQRQVQGGEAVPSPLPPPSAEEEEEARGVKLGLGDFIFYSVLVGKSATADDWTTVFACYIGILVGLALTLLLLSIYQKALPALPISIFFGIIFFFSTSHLLEPLVDHLAARQVYM